jgi:hypothetical protein
MNYNISDFPEIDIQTFKDEISRGLEFELSFPLSSIGFTNSRIDIIRDYSEVSYCCERIAPFLDVLDSALVTRDKIHTDFKIVCKAIDPEKLATDLQYISAMLNGESDEYDDIDRGSFFDEVAEYEETYNKRVFVFPELINNYWANLINGAYWEIASEYYESETQFFRKTYRKYPEHRFGFWKSPSSINFKDLIYFSTENWIIPPGTNLISSLKAYSGLENNLTIENADKVEFNGATVLLTNSTAVYFSHREQLINSIKFTERLLEKNSNDGKSKEKRNTFGIIQESLFGEPVLKGKRSRVRRKSEIQIDPTEIRYKVSEFGDLIVVEYKGFNFIFFSSNTLSFEEIKDLHSVLHPAYSKTQNLINKSISGRCNWPELSDDTFEELCYDILYCHSQFDSSTIQKMGKSRSRDGGRDITIMTKRTPTNEPELYIFQCKYISDNSSLSAAKVSNAGNVIMQYGAKGYGIFTTTVIDATLYDMLDGFNRNMRVNTFFRWSKYELERYLNTHDALKRKYFSVSTIDF